MIEKLTAVREKFLNGSESLFEYKTDDPRKVIPLSLEYKKKQAKKLLKSLRSSASNKEWARVSTQHSQAGELNPEKIKLADAQWVIAKESGFGSWAKLKHHIEASRMASDVVESGQPSALDDDKKSLHIRCGSDLMLPMAIAGFTGDYLVFADPYVMGAVPQTETEDEFIRIRAEVISNNFTEHKQAYQDLSDDYAPLQQAGEYERLMFWFEHDAYDVLAFLKLLHFFSDPQHRPADVQFICITDYPGVKRFNGIGQLPAEAMRVLWDDFKTVDEALFEFGRLAWEAYTSPDPKSFYRLAFATDIPLPALIPAMRRQLQELPWSVDGLSLTEHLTLQILADKGSMNAAELFFKWYTLHYEPLVFWGDLMYWKVLDALALGENPAITFKKPSEKIIEWQVSLTSFGEDLLKRKAHWVQSNGYDRWFGGTHNTSEGKCWYWDDENQKVTQSFSF